MKPISSPQNQGQDQEIIEILKGLDSSNAEYPSDLLAARRAAFIAQVRQYSKDSVREEQSSEDQFIKQLQGLQSVSVEYPRELLTARRAAFIAQVEQHSGVEVKEELFAEDQSIIRLFKSIKAIEPEYLQI